MLDLRGQTSIRNLIRLVHWSSGVLTPVSFLMHLSAAVEVKPQLLPQTSNSPFDGLRAFGNSPPASRPCVVVAGGREPPHWEAYPNHQFIHTVGALDCCRTGGCWRSRTRALGDGSEHDSPRRLCVDVVNGLPHCMDMITSADVIRRIEMYLEGEGRKPKAEGNVVAATTRAPAEPPAVTLDGALTEATAKEAMDRAIESMIAYPTGRFGGRGIVICAGGPTYAACAWVCIQMLRRAGCSLPIQLWHRGDEELPAQVRALFASESKEGRHSCRPLPRERQPPRAAVAAGRQECRPSLNVECIDAIRMSRRYPVRRLGGWELKAYALLNSPFEDVLLLDADNVPLIDPERLFDTEQFARDGAIFWPDLGRLAKDDPIWDICGIPHRDEPEVESGQLLVNKQRCWRALSLALWMNEHSDFFYKHLHGDKETFHLAFRRVNQPYAMPAKVPRILKGALLQHDFELSSIRWTAKAG